MDDIKNIVLVGGTGFIGSELTKKLSNVENLDISVIYVGELNKTAKVEGVNYQKIDLSQKSQEAKQVFLSADCVVMMTQPDGSLMNNFLKLAEDSSLTKIVYTSTMLLYSDSTEKHDESDNLVPINNYEKGKYNEEKLLKEFANSKTNICIVRLGNVYGNKKSKGIINLIIEALENKKTLKINGDGEHQRDYIFIEDVVRAIEQLIFIDQEEYLEVYNVCTGSSRSINQLINELEKILGKTIIKENGDQISEKKSVGGNNEKLQKKINFKIKFDLQQGLVEACKNYLN